MARVSTPPICVLQEHGKTPATSSTDNSENDRDNEHTMTDAVMVEGIDVSFKKVKMTEDGERLRDDEQHRSVRQRTTGPPVNASVETSAATADIDPSTTHAWDDAASLEAVQVERGEEKWELEGNGDVPVEFCRACDDVTVYDLLSGYFKYFAVEFRHDSEVSHRIRR